MMVWGTTLLTVAVLAGYELVVTLIARYRPTWIARSSHAQLRDLWLDAIARHEGTEILAVQTLRNSLMSATMTASTAALALMGTVTLAAPSLHEALANDIASLAQLRPRLILELVLLTLLFISLVSSAMAVRYYTHVSFIAGLPNGSPAKAHWLPIGRRYIRQAGRLYSLGLRHLVLVVPVVAALLHPLAGPIASLVVVTVMVQFDRFRQEMTASAE